MSGTIPLSPPYAIIAWTANTFYISADGHFGWLIMNGEMKHLYGCTKHFQIDCLLPTNALNVNFI
jgi:hypothetical protein